MSPFLVETFSWFLAHDLHVSSGNAAKMWPPSLPACLSSFTDWCLVHRQQSREQKNLVRDCPAREQLCGEQLVIEMKIP